MAILWTGAEDIDWPILGSGNISTTGGRFRSGWARCAINQPLMNSSNQTHAHSTSFNGGALTSAWLSCQLFGSFTNPWTNMGFIGFCLSGTNNSLGIGIDPSNQLKYCLFKYDGTTRTNLASEGGTSFGNNILTRIDIQVVSYGAAATVNVYVSGVNIISFTGDVTVSGMTNFDSLIFYGTQSMGVAATPSNTQISEVFVADSDTRGQIGMLSLALTGAGTTTGWSNNTYTNINGISFSDANAAFENTAAVDQQYTVTIPTPAAYSVTAVSINARLARPSTATPTQVKLGYGNGAAGAFGTGAAKTPGVGFSWFEQIDAINPVTGVAFTQADLAALQLDLESA